MNLSLLLLLLTTAQVPSPERLVREGSSPQIAVDSRGIVRMVFGRKDSIFVVTSTDSGSIFTAATLVAVVPDMHLGNTRGPVIASSRTRTLILAADSHGTLTTFRLDHRTNRWSRNPRPLNDAEGSAPEGLATIAADGSDNFYAVWLDLRQARQNNIYFTRVPLAGEMPVANRLVYASPDGHVCECCRPSVAVSGRRIAVMFRNWLGGARDLYLTRSADAGKTFSDPTKLGTGTWKLDACPMDGGSLALTPSGDVMTTWRRENTVYTASPSGPEQRVSDGKSPMMSARDGDEYVVWQDGATIKLTKLGSPEATVGEGRLPQVAALKDGGVLVAWERAGNVYCRKL